MSWHTKKTNLMFIVIFTKALTQESKVKVVMAKKGKNCDKGGKIVV